MDLIMSKKDAEKRAKKEWENFYTSPLLLYLPYILIIILIEIPKLIELAK